MSLLEESLFSDSGASIRIDLEAGSGPTIRPLRPPRTLRENRVLPSCLRAGGGLCDLCELCVKMRSCLRVGGGTGSRFGRQGRLRMLLLLAAPVAGAFMAASPAVLQTASGRGRSESGGCGSSP